jgi:hypothetical protein
LFCGFASLEVWAAAVVAAAVTFAEFVAVAAPASAPGTNGQVELVAATTDEAQMKRLEAAVQEAALAVQLRVVANRVARIDPAAVLTGGVAGTGVSDPTFPVARLWIDAANGSPATLYLTDGARRRVYIRQVPLERGLLDRVSLESVALILGSSLDALVAGRDIGVSREDFAQRIVVAPAPASVQGGGDAPAPPRPTPAPSPSVREATLSAGYELVRAAPLPYQHRLVVDGQLRWRRAHVAAGLVAALPQTVQRGVVSARLLTGGAHVTAGVRWVAVGSIQVTAGAALGIEAARVEPNVGTTELHATPPFWSGAMSARAFGLVERKLTPISDRWVVGLLVGIEIHPSPERYVISEAEGRQVLLQAPRWRPLAAALIGWQF